MKHWAMIGAAGLVGLSACAMEPVSQETEGINEELINGTETYERPEIGRLSGCTATLVDHNVVISAAHCVNFATRDRPGNYGRFTVDIGPGQSRSFNIERMISYSRGNLGRDDVVLMRLSSSVPADVARPTGIADREPAQGELATLFGYGCTNRRTQGGTFVKRKLEYQYQQTNNLCPGDSGGPGVIGKDGPVFLINSGYYTGGGGDIFGEPWQFKQRLVDQIVAWNGSYNDPMGQNQDPAPGPDVAPQPEPDIAPDPNPNNPAPDPGPVPEDDRCPFAEDSEPNDSLEAAGAIGQGQITGSVCEGDEDIFRVQMPGPWRAYLRFHHPVGDLDMEALDDQGQATWESTTAEDMELVYGNGDGFVKIYGFEGGVGRYSLQIVPDN